jgi:hypothetical protein
VYYLKLYFVDHLYLAPAFNIDVSSAYIIDLPFVSCGISFIYMMKSNGPRTDSWGTPYLTGRLVVDIATVWDIVVGD